ncbi:MAG: chemotaxis protein CheX [Candidatus Acidiferrum sp.]
MSSFSKTASPAAVAFDPSWKTILECAAVEVFEMMAGVRPELNSASTGEPTGETTAMVGMAGALCGMTTLRCAKATAGRFAALMLGEAAASDPSSSGDALGELCNMVAGNFKSKISNLADHCMLSVPTVITGQDYSMETSEPTQGILVPLLFEGQPLWVSLIIHT